MTIQNTIKSCVREEMVSIEPIAVQDNQQKLF